VADRLYEQQASAQGQFVVPLYVNGKELIGYRDTGCQGPTLVDTRYVRESDYTGKHIYCRG